MTLARIELLLAATLFSTAGAAMKLVRLNAWQVAGFRAGVAVIALWLLVPESRRVSRRSWIVGVAQAATFVTFVMANKLTTAASAVFFQGSAPLWLFFLGPLILGERSSRRDLPFLGVILLGLVLLLQGTPPHSATAPNVALGNVVGAVSGMMWAFTIAGLRWAARDGGPGGPFPAISATLCGNAMACLCCLPLAFPVVDARPADWIGIAYLGVVQVGLAYVFMTRGLRKVRVVEASLLLLLEPALSPLWALIVNGERPGMVTLAGGVLIIGATAWKAARRPAAPQAR